MVKCRFSVEVHESTIGKWLHQLGLTRLQPRPVHPKKDPEAETVFKKRARIGGPPVAVETGCATLDRRGVAEKFSCLRTFLSHSLLVHNVNRKFSG
ncbi:MAG: hypothetical protein QOD93_3087, partial [Acetobacteraceae bacterium]|nr:hypothetical protein [Acetobacteraceae bacterium]